MSVAVIDRVVSVLSGNMLKEGILSAALRLERHKGEVDALNVFPVPDGDTGTNMALTLAMAAKEIISLSGESAFCDVAERIASATLRSARGNSGVILSLIFRGFAQSAVGLEHIGGAELAHALECGSHAAYRAVANPAEGTILTVIREAAYQAAEVARVKPGDAIAVWMGALHGACESLAETPMLLPVLQEAGVVDAGGQGLVYVMEGLLQGFLGRSHTDEALPMPEPDALRRFLATIGADAAQIKFTYCAECLIQRDGHQNTEELRRSLEKIGDCVVVAGDEDVIKIHTHTNRPGDVLNLAQVYGQFMETKIENMRIQQEAFGAEDTRLLDPEHGGAQLSDAAQQKQYGVVVVANGNGIERIFNELGADALVRGGQSMNPSTEEILRAVERVNAGHVFVLPNNKNIIMAAEQAALLSDKNVSVLHTGSVVEGIAALLEFDESADAEENHARMRQAAGRVQTGLVTYAARDSDIDGMRIRAGDVIGLENGRLTLKEQEPVAAACRVAQNLVSGHGGSMVTIYPGEGIAEEQTNRLLEHLKARFGDMELSAVPGGQPMYFFMIAVE